MPEQPVTLEQVKAQLKLDANDTSQDDHLKLLIASASRLIERYTGRAIVATHPDIDPRDKPLVAMACLVAITHWFVNREGEEDLPPAASGLVRRLRRRVL